MILNALLIVGWVITGACIWKLVRSRAPAPRLRWFVISVLTAGCMFFLSGVYFLIRSFHILSRETPVAAIEVRPSGERKFQFAYYSLSASGETRIFTLSGEQWLLSGGFIKWHPLIRWAGVPPFFIPLRVEGRYARAAEQSRQPITAFALNPDVEARWDLVYAASRWLPFVDASYGSAVFVPVTREGTFELTAGHDGFIVRPIAGFGGRIKLKP